MQTNPKPKTQLLLVLGSLSPLNLNKSLSSLPIVWEKREYIRIRRSQWKQSSCGIYITDGWMRPSRRSQEKLRDVHGITEAETQLGDKWTASKHQQLDGTGGDETSMFCTRFSSWWTGPLLANIWIISACFGHHIRPRNIWHLRPKRRRVTSTELRNYVQSWILPPSFPFISNYCTMFSFVIFMRMTNKYKGILWNAISDGSERHL